MHRVPRSSFYVSFSLILNKALRRTYSDGQTGNTFICSCVFLSPPSRLSPDISPFVPLRLAKDTVRAFSLLPLVRCSEERLRRLRRRLATLTSLGLSGIRCYSANLSMSSALRGRRNRAGVLTEDTFCPSEKLEGHWCFAIRSSREGFSLSVRLGDLVEAVSDLALKGALAIYCEFRPINLSAGSSTQIDRLFSSLSRFILLAEGLHSCSCAEKGQRLLLHCKRMWCGVQCSFHFRMHLLASLILGVQIINMLWLAENLG